MTRVAAFDCGTNSLRLLIADVEGGVLTDVVRDMEVVRLGQGVDETGRFDPAALERTLGVTRRYAAQAEEHGTERVRFVATSATRDAANRGEFIDAVEAILGTPPEVIPGTEEAALSFRGAVSVLDPAQPRPVLVVDLGGGSTELVLGTDEPDAAYSMDIGCVRLTERHLRSDPPTEAEIAAARTDIRAALAVAGRTVDLSAPRAIVGVAGTITTVTATALDLPAYDPERISGTELPLAEVLAACERLLHLPRAERAALPFMHPGRVDVIGAGALVWSEILLAVAEATGAAGHPLESVVTSEHDILDGIALALAEG
jgi:exopolyphosphatase / guanosine-5'-triphosphate,3'-diphosphate pyrophosphatase